MEVFYALYINFQFIHSSVDPSSVTTICSDARLLSDVRRKHASATFEKPGPRTYVPAGSAGQVSRLRGGWQLSKQNETKLCKINE